VKHRTAELEGALLDAAVAKAEGRLVTPADEHPDQPGFYQQTRKEWGEHIVRWYAREGENADGPETDEEGGWEVISAWGSPSTNWSDGGPIIERERIEIAVMNDEVEWYAGAGCVPFRGEREFEALGPTPLIAAMRAYVASKLGAEVELP
jgi:hypothetical protein